MNILKRSIAISSSLLLCTPPSPKPASAQAAFAPFIMLYVVCPSEVSDIDEAIWQVYRDAGVVVWGIGSEDPLASLQAFTEQMGVTFPVLFDGGGQVHAQYDIGPRATNPIHPQDWIVGVDGTLVYVNNTYEPSGMIAGIEAELAKQ